MFQDEVLAHRIGLIPLNLDPDKFEFKSGLPSPLLHSAAGYRTS